jgi:transposase-like protein
MSTDDLLSRRPRTKRVFSEADMARLRDLYYDPNVPLIDAADAFGVPMSTLTRWIIEMRWPRKSTGWRPAGMAPVAAAPRIAKSEPHPASAVEGDAAPHPVPLPASRERGSTPLDPDRLAVEVLAHARVELAAMGEAGGPLATNLPLAERKRRADIIASLARSIANLDKSFERKAEHKRLKRLVREQQEKINALQNAGLIDVQRAKFALLKQEFEKTKG